MKSKYNLIHTLLFLVIFTLFYPLASANQVEKISTKDSKRSLVARSITKKSKLSYKVVVVTALGTLLLMGGLIVVILFIRNQRQKEETSQGGNPQNNTLDQSNNKNNEVNTEVDLKPGLSFRQLTEENTFPVVQPEEVDHSSKGTVSQNNQSVKPESETLESKSETLESESEISEALKLGKHKSFDELELRYQLGVDGGPAINMKNTFIATKSCLISGYDFWKPFQEKQTIWVVSGETNSNTLIDDLKKLVKYIRKRAPDQSIHINTGGKGDQDGNTVYDKKELADISFSMKVLEAIKGWENISLHRMSNSSDATYPKKANHVIDVWSFSRKTREKRHCQAFKEYISRREKLFNPGCIERTFLAGSNIEVPLGIEGLIEKFTGHPLNSINKESEQAILDIVRYCDDFAEYDFLTSLGLEIWHSPNFIERELENRYFEKRKRNQMNNPNYYTERIKNGLFEELLEKLHFDSCRMLIGHPAFLPLRKRGFSFNPNQVFQDRMKKVQLPKLSGAGLHVKAKCVVCNQEKWYPMGTGETYVITAISMRACPKNHSERRGKMIAQVMAFQQCQYHIQTYRIKDQQNPLQCEEEDVVNDRGKAYNSTVLKEIYNVLYREIYVETKLLDSLQVQK